MVLPGMYLLTLLVALPLSIALRGMIAAHLGDSLFADRLATGASYDWWQEFLAQASGLGTTFVPSIIGFGAVLDNLGGLLDNLPMATTIAGRHGGVARPLVVPERRRARSLRPHAAHAHASGSSPRAARTSGAFSGSGSSRSWRTTRSSGSSTRGSSTTSIRGPRAT